MAKTGAVMVQCTVAAWQRGRNQPSPDKPGVAPMPGPSMRQLQCTRMYHVAMQDPRRSSIVSPATEAAVMNGEREVSPR